MTRAVALQMDPVESIDILGDSSFVLGLEAQRRGHRLYHYLPRDLSFRDGRVYARMRPLSFRREQGNHASLGDAEMVDLKEMDVVLMRQDPPFDMSYITATHMLEQVHPGTLVVNDPSAVRNAPEKIFVTHYPELMPPTLISCDPLEIRDFREAHQDIIIKPLFGNGGAGVFHIQPGNENLNALLELFTELYREPIIAQLYMPEVRQGDKRIILIDGEAAGAVNRIPAAGEARSNMHVGGRPEKAGLDARDREICEAIGPTLKERGLIFVGIDVIGGFMTEINVTSPTGLQEIDRFDDTNLEALIWDAIEARL
jgi:glutathione synthase